MTTPPLSNGAADALYFQPDARAAMCRRIVDAYFAGIEFIQATVLSLGNIGHDHIGTCLKGHNASLGMQALHRRGSGNVDVGQEQTHGSHGAQRHFQGATRFAGQRSLRMGDERTDSCHIDADVLEVQQVVSDGFNRLTRQTHHDAGAEFKAQFPNHEQALMATLPTHARVKAVIQVTVGGLDAHQVTVGACFTKCLIILIITLTNAERQCDIESLDPLNDAAHARLVEMQVFARLQDDSLETQADGSCGGFHHLLIAHAITLHLPVAAANAAIQAIVAADVGELNETTQVDIVTYRLTAHLVGPPIKFLCGC